MVPAAPTPFAPGQVVTVFRSRLRPDANTPDDAADGGPTYTELAAEILAIARSMPGYVEYKVFTAEDGERVALVTFDSPASQKAWREHPRHQAAQRRGRDRYYAEYSIQVSDCTAVHAFMR